MPNGALHKPAGPLNNPAGPRNRPAGVPDFPFGALDFPAALLNTDAGQLDKHAGRLNWRTGRLNKAPGRLDKPSGPLNRTDEALKDFMQELKGIARSKTVFHHTTRSLHSLETVFGLGAAQMPAGANEFLVSHTGSEGGTAAPSSSAHRSRGSTSTASGPGITHSKLKSGWLKRFATLNSQGCIWV